MRIERINVSKSADAAGMTYCTYVRQVELTDRSLMPVQVFTLLIPAVYLTR